MSSKGINWNSDASYLRKALLKLTKPRLIKLCKTNKISPNGTKQDMITSLIKNNEKNKSNPRKPKKVKAKSKKKMKSATSEIKQPVTTPTKSHVPHSSRNSTKKDIFDASSSKVKLIQRLIPYFRSCQCDISDKHYYTESTGIGLEKISISCQNIQDNIEDFISQFHRKYPRGDINAKFGYPSFLEQFQYDPNLSATKPEKQKMTAKAENQYQRQSSNDDALDLGDDMDMFDYDIDLSDVQMYAVTEPTIVLTEDLESSNIKQYRQTLEKVVRLLTGQRNRDTVEMVISGFSKNYTIPKDIIALCCDYFSTEQHDINVYKNGHNVITNMNSSWLTTQEKVEIHIKSLKAIYKGNGTADAMYIAPLALDWDKCRGIDLKVTIEDVTNVLYEVINAEGLNGGWKCVIIRYNGQPNYVNEYSHRYDEWCYADDNWYLWWMIDNDNKTKDQSDCFVLRFTFNAYEKKETYSGIRY